MENNRKENIIPYDMSLYSIQAEWKTKLSWIVAEGINVSVFNKRSLLFSHVCKDIVAYKGLHKSKQIICKYGIP